MVDIDFNSIDLSNLSKNDSFSKLFIFYVNKYSLQINDYKVYAYICRCIGPLHTMGEILYRSMEHIKRIDFVEYTQDRYEYILSKRVPIVYFSNKYKSNAFLDT